MHGSSLRRIGAVALTTAALLVALASAAHAGEVVAHGNLPDAVVDRDGVTHLVFNESHPDAGGVDVLHYCQVPRGTLACTNEQQLPPPPNGGLPSWDLTGPKVMITPFGEVVLLTHRIGKNYIYVSDDGGASFTGPTELGTISPGGPAEPAWAVFDGADRRIITIAAPTGGVRLQGAPLGPTTSAYAQLSTENSYEPSVVQRGPGSFAAAWRNLAGTTFVRTFDCAGCPLDRINNQANWTPAVAVPEAELPRLATGPNGTFLFYRSTAAATERQWMVRRLDGTALSDPTPISEPQAPGAFRDVLEDPAGLLHLLYIGTGNTLSYRASADGAAWGDANILAPGPDFTIQDPRLAARTTDDGFTGYAFWESQPGNEPNPAILAAALPDPSASLPKPPPPPPPPGGGQPPPPPPPPAPPDPCRTLSFAAVDVIADVCLKRDGDAYVATGGVQVNGLRVELGSGRLRLLPKARRITSSGAKVTLKVGDTVLVRDDLDWQLPKGSRANLGSLSVGGAGGKLLGFPLVGSAELRLRGGGAEIPVHLGLPALFGGVTGDVTIRADNVAGVHLRELHVKVGNAFLGVLQVKNLTFDYDADASSWQGGATLILPPQPPGPSLESHIGFTGGELDYLRNELTLPGPGIPLDPLSVVYLRQIRFSLETKPVLSLSGGVTLTAGPTVAGVAAIGVRGDLRFTFPNPPQPAILRADGTVSLFSLDLGSAYFELRMNGYVGFGGKLDYELGSFSAKATLDGWLYGKAFNVEAGAAVCLGDLGCAKGAVVVSSEGFAGCAYTDIADFGAGYRWGESFDLMFTGCDIGPYRATAAQAGGAPEFRLKGGLPSAVVAVRGDGAPSDVGLVGPAGQRVAPPADGPLRTPDAIAFHVAEQQTTYFVLRRPAAGAWRVEAAPGSAPVKQVRAADGLAKPSITAQVTRGPRGTRILRYRVAARAGQRVTFAEQGKGAARRLGSVRQGTGTIRFTPADGPGGRRTIVAQVSTNGRPRAALDVARYTAPPPRRPSAPRGLRARRSGTTLTVTWRASRNAKRYQVRAVLSDGRRLMFLQPGRRVVLRRVTRRTRVTVTVRGLKPDGVAGRPATLRVRR